MRVCGVELKGNDAIICIMSRENGLYDIPHARVPKIAINDAGDAEQMKKFQFTFAKLMADYQVEKVLIKGRALKGKFAGGPVGFKLEAAIQLIPELNVELIASNRIQELLKQNPLMIDFKGTGLKQFQQTAFQTAYAYLNQ